MRIGLVACVKSKRDTATRAADLYTSPLFRGGRRAVEASCDRWFILSAKHGLLDPAAIVEPYEETLSGASRRRKRAWSSRVLTELGDVVDIGASEFEIHAGKDYYDWGLSDGLCRAGAHVEIPTAGLPLGRKLAYYSGGSSDRSSAPIAGSRRSVDASRAAARAAPPSPGSSYRRLYRYLSEFDGGVWTATFAEIEEVLDRELPASARAYPAWWSNSVGSHSHASAWMAAGWRTSDLRLDSERVTFSKESS